MSVLTLVPHRPPARHRRPRFPGVRNLMTVRIPRAINDVWNAAERRPVRAFAVVVLVLVVAPAALVVAPWAFVLLLAALVLGVAIGRASKGGPR